MIKSYMEFKMKPISLVLSATLSGCAVGPNYVAPKSNLTRFHNQVTTGSGALSLDRWWMGFKDSDLVRIIECALDQNLDLAAAFARVKQSRAVASGSGAQLLPTAEFNAAVTRQH